MPPIPAAPKVIVYHQTHHTNSGEPISLLPVLRLSDGHGGPSASPAVTHVIVGAVHLNEDPEAITLNDHPPDHKRFSVLWTEVRAAQNAGVRVLAMLGGAAKGSYQRLETHFERYYGPLCALLRARRFDGVDLDVEEPMSLVAVVRLIDRLRADFGPRFLVTLAPVAAALLRPGDPRCNLSGFSYAELEACRGREIAWYHAQFYCGWGDASQPDMYLAMTSGIIAPIPGLLPHRVVMGLVTNPSNGPGWVELDRCTEVLLQLCEVAAARDSLFAGVSGWEYFNGMPGARDRPWEWAEWMSAILGSTVDPGQGGGPYEPSPHLPPSKPPTAPPAAPASPEADPDIHEGPEAPLPAPFLYQSDTED